MGSQRIKQIYPRKMHFVQTGAFLILLVAFTVVSINPRYMIDTEHDPRNLFSNLQSGIFKKSGDQRELLRDMFNVYLKRSNPSRINPIVSDYLREFPFKRNSMEASHPWLNDHI